jgi:putative intracellular protease/amidase
MPAGKVLIIVTSHAQLGSTGRRTGFWFEELAAPYYELVDGGVSVDIASPAGGRAPADPASENDAPASVRRFLADAAAMDKLAHTLRLDAVGESYDAYFVAGGHGVMWDLASDGVTARLLGGAADAGKLIAAVCHGPAALVGVQRGDGTALVAGKRVAAFSNEEERAVKLDGAVPFALEDRLKQLGAHYERGPMWGAFAVRDGALITGQNPQSSLAVAQALLAALRER